MGIAEDAFHLLTVIYKKPEISSEDVSSLMGWDKDKVLNAVKYLEQEGLIENLPKNIMLNGERIMLKCSSGGINIIEGKESSENRYGVTFQVNFIINANFESLLKAEVGSLFKISLI